jgi:hypothetical protein
MNGCSADPAGARPILMPIWTISDVTPEGRYPRLNY